MENAFYLPIPVDLSKNLGRFLNLLQRFLQLLHQKSLLRSLFIQLPVQKRDFCSCRKKPGLEGTCLVRHRRNLRACNPN